MPDEDDDDLIVINDDSDDDDAKYGKMARSRSLLSACCSVISTTSIPAPTGSAVSKSTANRYNDYLDLMTDDEDDECIMVPVPRVLVLNKDKPKNSFVLGSVPISSCSTLTSNSSVKSSTALSHDKPLSSTRQIGSQTSDQKLPSPSAKSSSISELSSMSSKSRVVALSSIPSSNKLAHAKATAVLAKVRAETQQKELARQKFFNKHGTSIKIKGGIRQQLAASYGNRIPIPGGGSANVMPSSSTGRLDETLAQNSKAVSSVSQKKPTKLSDEKVSLFQETCLKRTISKNQTMTKMTDVVESIIASQQNDKKEIDKFHAENSKNERALGISDSSNVPGSSQAALGDQPIDLPLKTKRAVSCNLETKKKLRVCDTDYEIEKVIADKRAKHENIQVSPKKPLGPPPNTIALTNAKIQPTSSVLQNQLSLLPKEVSSKTYSADPILAKILEWKATWMKESKTVKNKPPPISDKPLQQLRLTYSSLKEYCDIYEPLILHEIWGQVMQAFESGQSNSNMYLALFSYEATDNFLRLDCQALCTFKDMEEQKHIAEGQMVLVELHPENGNSKVVFGYVQDFSSEDINDRSISISRNLKIQPNHKLVLKYHIRTKLRYLKLDTTKTMRVTAFYYLRPMLRNVEAMFSLENSRLCEDILNPSKMACQMAFPNSIELPADSYNESQFKAILASVEAIQRPYPIPKMLLVQGPPGTGKTFTLIGMIKRIFIDWDDSTTTPKILVCTPSNGAVDEIARRLHEVRHFLTKSFLKRSLRLVRLGQPSQIHPSVRKFCLDELVDSNLKTRKNEVASQHQAKINQLKDLAAEKDRLIAEYRARNEKDKANQCSSEMYQIYRDIKMAQNELNRSEECGGGEKKHLKLDILRKADVILSTLNSCRHSLLELVYNTERDPVRFNCVIIDEASQCAEPEILMPLMYTSISKMILIGDPMQLPATVISPYAAEFQYGRSLFERIFLQFGRYSKKSPVLMLDTQYRMHSAICMFPSFKFYDDRLKTPQSIDKREFPLRPYMVFDLRGASENLENPKNITNILEAEFVMNLYASIRELVPKSHSIGIVTPYQGQKKLLSQKLEKFKDGSPDVNTIDGFQGQERDVIILSLVRDFSKKENGIGFLASNHRLNVALTRAKNSLFICISDTSSVSNDLWKSLLENAESRNVLIKTSCKSKRGFQKLIAR